MKKSYYLLILFLVANSLAFSQPYIYKSVITKYGWTIENDSTYSYENYTDIYKINLATGNSEIFYKDLWGLGHEKIDEPLLWGERFMFLQYPDGIEIIDLTDTSKQYKILKHLYYPQILYWNYIPWQNKIYIEAYWFHQDTIDTTVVVSLDISNGIEVEEPVFPPWSFLSSDSSIGYFQERTQYEPVDKLYLIAFSTNTFQEVWRRSLEHVPIGITPCKMIVDGENGLLLIEYTYPCDIPFYHDGNYFAVYNPETDSVYSQILFPYRSRGYFTKDAKYVIAQEVAFDTTREKAEKITGRINVYKSNTGELVKELMLPPNGELYFFNEYPNKFYYYVPETKEAITININNSLIKIDIINPAMSLVNPGAFTMAIKGTGFTTNSTVYFNGSSRATTFISDSVLNAEILSTDVSLAGNYPVWVSDGTTNSDTLIYKVVSTLPQPVRPVLECVRNNGDGTYTAFFGYKNDNNVSVYIPVGGKNKFTPTPQDRGQPRVFESGRHYKVFTVNFNGSNLVWTLNGRTSTASSNSAPCN